MRDNFHKKGLLRNNGYKRIEGVKQRGASRLLHFFAPLFKEMIFNLLKESEASEAKNTNLVERKYSLNHFAWAYRIPLILTYRINVLHHHHRLPFDKQYFKIAELSRLPCGKTFE